MYFLDVFRLKYVKNIFFGKENDYSIFDPSLWWLNFEKYNILSLVVKF